jgi:hypothetical protein
MEAQIPGGGFVDETATEEQQIPGSQFVNETQSTTQDTLMGQACL